MTVSQYISQLGFDFYRLYFRENNIREIYFLDKNNSSLLFSSANGAVLQNSIFSENGSINPTFKEIKASYEIGEIRDFVNLNTQRIYPSRKNTIYNAALLFFKNNEIIGGINFDLMNRLAKSIKGQPLFISEEFYDGFKKVMENAGDGSFQI